MCHPPVGPFPTSPFLIAPSLFAPSSVPPSLYFLSSFAPFSLLSSLRHRPCASLVTRSFLYRCLGLHCRYCNFCDCAFLMPGARPVLWTGPG